MPLTEQAKLDELAHHDQPSGTITSLEVGLGWQTQTAQLFNSLQRDWFNLIRWLGDELARHNRWLWCDRRLQDPSSFVLEPLLETPPGPRLDLIRLETRLDHDAPPLASVSRIRQNAQPAQLPGLELLAWFCLNPRLVDCPVRIPPLALAGIRLQLRRRTCQEQVIVMVVDEAGLGVELRSADRGGGCVVPRRVIEPHS
ncbi:MAG TPA: hypothetical protein VLI05_05190 [Candidatus Saccharimonadia bacterium]|nr:hypothetical protein [Candidatus Saccharimonadia bacterium]